MNSGVILKDDVEIAPYIDNFPHWSELHEKGLFEKEKALMTVQNWQLNFNQLSISKYEGAFSEATPTLATVKKYLSKDHLDALLTKIIQDFMDNINLPPISPVQAQTLVRIIYENFHYFNLADFRLFFDNMLRGRYGKIYGRLDVEVILNALETYSENRLSAGSETTLKKHHNQKNTALSVDIEVIKRLKSHPKIKKIGQLKIEYDDICDFASDKDFDVNSFIKFCEANIQKRYKEIYPPTDEDGIDENQLLLFRGRWIDTLLNWINNGNINSSKRELFNFIQNLQLTDK